MFKSLRIVMLALGTTAISVVTAAQGNPALRERFVEAEALIAQGALAPARIVMQDLTAYPLYPYLVHGALAARLAEAPADAVRDALKRYPDLPATRDLQEAWILELARREDWRTLAADADTFSAARSSASLCRVAEAAWRTGDAESAWPIVARLWPSPRSLPDACDPVLAAWRDAGKMSAQQIWRRLLRAVPAGSSALVNYLGKLLPSDQQQRLQRWLALRANPQGLAGAIAQLDAFGVEREAVVLDVFQRLARQSPAQAERELSGKFGTSLSPSTRAQATQALGMQLARRNDQRAFRHLLEGHAPAALEARAELALGLHDWHELEHSVALMDPATAASGRWRYWAARSRALRDATFADPVVTALAAERGYYAFLAADRLGLPYNMAPVAIKPSRTATASVMTHAALARIEELQALARARYARDEWLKLLSNLDDVGKRAAARIAADRNWHALAIFAASKAQSWDDLELRFPLAHRQQVERAATSSSLQPSRIYAIIRQESAFMADVQSRAGALGLMQLMPATARQVARQQGLERPGKAAVLDPTLNIRLGSSYLAGLHRRYADHPVLAAAAYNAGPGNVARWRPTSGRAPAEQWIEAIPFRETRGYVRRVLAYQAIYRFRMGQPMIRISDWMPPVPAK